MTTGLHTREYVFDDTYTAKVYETLEGFLSLRETWDEILRIHGAHEPFLCHDWFRIWLKHFLGDANLFIIILYRDKDPVLIAPLIRKKERYKRVASVRKIELIGNIHSPVKNVFFGETDSCERAASLRHLFNFFTTEFKNWDIIELDSIPEEIIPSDIMISSVTKSDRSLRKYNCFNDWYLDGISYSSQEYFDRLPKKIRDELKRRQKRINEIGNVSFEIGFKDEQFSRYVDQYNSVRERSWKSPESDKAFLYDVRKMVNSKGWLRSAFLYVDSVPIAAQIRYVANGTGYFMEALHDKRYDKYGPGNLLRLKVIEHLIDSDQVSVIDQLRGNEPYKEYWTHLKRDRYGISIFNKTIKGYFFNYILLRLLPRIKKYTQLTNIF